MRDWMITLRESQGLTQRKMAKKAHVSLLLIRWLEEWDSVTLPIIAVELAAAYGMSTEQMREIGKTRRPDSTGIKFNRDPCWYEKADKLIAEFLRKQAKAIKFYVDDVKLTILLNTHKINRREMSVMCGYQEDYFSSLVGRARHGEPFTENQLQTIEKAYNESRMELQKAEGSAKDGESTGKTNLSSY